jgi:purine nucleosidase
VTVANDGFGRPGRAPVSAAELIARTVLRSDRPFGARRVTVIATGPLTNLAEAFRSRRVAAAVGHVRVMGGALRVPGTLYGSALPGFDNTQEFNMWLDPASARTVLHHDAALAADRAAFEQTFLDALNGRA